MLQAKPPGPPKTRTSAVINTICGAPRLARTLEAIVGESRSSAANAPRVITRTTTGVAVVTLALTVALYALEILVAFLQAYVFTILTCIYINDAIHPGH